MNKWKLMQQVNYSADEFLIFEGTYQECLKEMVKIEKGYIYKDLNDNDIHIAKTKGW